MLFLRSIELTWWSYWSTVSRCSALSSKHNSSVMTANASVGPFTSRASRAASMRLLPPRRLPVVEDRSMEWASTPIALGPGAQLTPMVLGPEGVPVVIDTDTAHRFPELALLSVMAHGQGDVQTAVNIARVAAAAASDLASDNQALYLDLIESALGEAARKAFEMLPETYKFQGPSYLRGRAEGEARGRAEGEARGEARGKAQAILAFLEMRGLAVSGEQRQRIVECTDLDRLGAWLRKAVTLTDVDELFAQ
jgi:hypothetical protein